MATTWKNAQVGDKAWITFYTHRYLQNAQHLCTVTFVGDKGILCKDDDGDYALLERDIVFYEKIDG